MFIAAGVALAAFTSVMIITHNNSEKDDILKSEEKYPAASASESSNTTDTVVQSESSYTQILEQHLSESEEIIQSLYFDYDNDGNYEMFSSVKDSSKNDTPGSLWFTDQNTCAVIKDTSASGILGKMKILYDKYSSLLYYSWETEPLPMPFNSCLFALKDGKPYEIPFNAKINLEQDGQHDGIISGIKRSSYYDCSRYYFFIENGSLKEYGFVPCERSFIEGFDNGEAVLQKEEEKLMHKITGFYRSDRLIAINFKVSIVKHLGVGGELCNKCAIYYITNNSLELITNKNNPDTEAMTGERYCFDQSIAVFPD